MTLTQKSHWGVVKQSRKRISCLYYGWTISNKTETGWWFERMSEAKKWRTQLVYWKQTVDTTPKQRPTLERWGQDDKQHSITLGEGGILGSHSLEANQLATHIVVLPIPSPDNETISFSLTQIFEFCSASHKFLWVSLSLSLPQIFWASSS
jgi:hypothetical protein